MPGTNLTRDEARVRAGLISDVRYAVELDLTSAPSGAPTFRSVTTLTFAAQPAASTFADLIAEQVHEITLNGRSLEVSTAYDGARIALDELTSTTSCGWSRTACTRGPARDCTGRSTCG